MHERLSAGADVLDIGCGGGFVVNLMARMFPNSRSRGYDISREAIETAREDAPSVPCLFGQTGVSVDTGLDGGR